MPYATHTRITFSGVYGTVAGPTEIWAMNLHCGPMQATTAAAAATAATACRTAWANFPKALLSSDITLTRTRVAVIGVDGRVAKDFDGSYKQGDDVVNVQSSNIAAAGSRLPTQAALVVSFSSARADATGKGRFFLPWQPAPNTSLLQSDFRLSAADQTSLLSTLAGFSRAVATAVGSPLIVPSSKGYNSPVTTVRLGRVIDTQRSRRNAMVEGYASVAL